MKKILSILLIICIMCVIAVPTYAINEANNSTVDSKIIYFDDGSYIVTTLVIETSKSEIATASTTYTKSGTKTVSSYTSDDELAWQYNLTGEFTVNEGVSVTCTSASYTKTINDSAWSFSNGSAYIENNVAHGEGTFKKKVLFITTHTNNIDITVSCDAYGNLS